MQFSHNTFPPHLYNLPGHVHDWSRCSSQKAANTLAAACQGNVSRGIFEVHPAPLPTLLTFSDLHRPLLLVVGQPFLLRSLGLGEESRLYIFCFNLSWCFNPNMFYISISIHSLYQSLQCGKNANCQLSFKETSYQKFIPLLMFSRCKVYRSLQKKPVQHILNRENSINLTIQ